VIPTIRPPLPGLEPAFDVAATLGPMEDHGVTRAGHRRVVRLAALQQSIYVAAAIRGGDSVRYTAYRVT
jgi:hypothetical protein